jgi:hypothetical protein
MLDYAGTWDHAGLCKDHVGTMENHVGIMCKPWVPGFPRDGSHDLMAWRPCGDLSMSRLSSKALN